MEVKLAIKDDLEKIKEILTPVVENLDNNNILIFNLIIVNNKFSCPFIVFDKCFINDSVNFLRVC